MTTVDLHDMEPEVFHEAVHSFDFWLQAVRGYLPDTDDEPAPGPPLAEPDRDALVTVLCNYCVGEAAALEGAGGLIRLAPNRPAKIFLSTQTVDEGRHLEVLSRRLRQLGVEDVDAEVQSRSNPFLQSFRERLLALVAADDWVSAVFAQNVILEAMEFSAFHHHLKTADPVTRELLEGIVKDERRHIGFGENEIGRCCTRDPELCRRLRMLRAELDYLVLGSFEQVVQELKAPHSDSAELGRSYLSAIERLGCV